MVDNNQKEEVKEEVKETPVEEVPKEETITPEAPKEEVKNEFEELDADVAPDNEFSEVPPSGDLISGGASGISYDWNSAPDSVKAPPRIDLNGQTVELKKADILLPPTSRKWDLTRDKSKEVKYCNFVLYFDKDGQQESLSGCRVFKREDGKYSHPTLTRDRANQASKLFGKYADYKQKDINECSLKEFMAFLNSKPKAVMIGEKVTNPVTNEVITKNFVDKFI